MLLRTSNAPLRAGLACLALLAAPALVHAGGTLTAKGSAELPIEIRDHRVEVVVQNGFARTEVTQTFFNPNAHDLEAIYRVPVPIGASLSEMEVRLGEIVLEGEVLRRADARTLYEEERDAGNEAGLAEQQESRVFDFFVSPVPAGGEAHCRYLYYEPLPIDTGIGRYCYPLEDGGTDDGARSFWHQETKVTRQFSFRLRLESAYAVDDVRVAGLEAASVVTKIEEGVWEVALESQGGVSLTRDIVVYYRLADGLPGRIELLAHRDSELAPGTFMLVVTPGVDLAPLTGGVDWVFVLDRSGSMKGKLDTLTNGVLQAIGGLDPRDRFRIVTFSDSADDLCGGFRPATRDEIERAAQRVRGLTAAGGTNLYVGIARALDGLDDDRATSVVLVTDGVANQGVVDPADFDRLMRRYDVRLFGFLLGNSANWPLMRIITEASGGFYATISNADDVLGQVLLAKSKVTHEALHDAKLTVRGVHTFDTGLGQLGKVYRGEQIVVFGRYEQGGKARVELATRITGEDKTYACDFEFPVVDQRHPEIERLWAIDRIAALQADIDRGATVADEAEDAIAGLGVAYQIVTEQTSMVVASDAAFDSRGIARTNRDRVANERAAQIARSAAPIASNRIDTQQPAFQGRSATTSSGGGDLGAIGLVLAGLLGAGAAAERRRRRSAAGATRS